MMAFLGLISIPALFFSVGIAFNAWRVRDFMAALKSGSIALVCLAVFIATPKTYGPEDDCRIDWDGRSNSQICQ